MSKLRLCWLRNFISFLSLQSFSQFQVNLGFIIIFKHVDIYNCRPQASYHPPCYPTRTMMAFLKNQWLHLKLPNFDAVRSHYLKHTCLSFAAKRGLDPHVRKLLGYHLDRHEVTLAACSRDLLAEPLRQFKTLLTEIQSGIAFSSLILLAQDFFQNRLLCPRYHLLQLKSHLIYFSTVRIFLKTTTKTSTSMRTFLT